MVKARKLRDQGDAINWDLYSARFVSMDRGSHRDTGGLSYAKGLCGSPFVRSPISRAKYMADVVYYTRIAGFGNEFDDQQFDEA